VAPHFEVTTEQMTAEVIRVMVAGEIDMAAHRDLANAVTAAAQQSGETLVDLGGVTFLDSGGIGALMAGYRAALDAGHVYRIANANGLVRQVLEVTGTLAVLTGDAS
jgi:anti-sigma B factor antagonist